MIRHRFWVFVEYLRKWRLSSGVFFEGRAFKKIAWDGKNGRV